MMIKLYLNDLIDMLLNMQNLLEAIGLIISTYFSIQILIWKNKQKLILNLINELYKLFEDNPQHKWLIGEKFYKIVGVRMNYDDIKDLLQDLNVTEITYLIKKYKRVYRYKNKKLIIINEFNNKFIRLFEKVFLFFSIGIFWMFFISSSFIFAFSNVMQDRIIFGIYIIISLVYLMIFLNWKDDKAKAKELIA